VKGCIEIEAERCKECELCIITCKHALIEKKKEYNAKGYLPAEFKDPGHKCNACALCAMVCPEVAIEVYRG
jgi:2-oxoglutarate ferredoxin oxidoreductase subunit delta